MGQCLCIIKPDAIRNCDVGEIISMIESCGFHIKFAQTKRLTYEKACEFYAEHKGKDFFENNVKFMSSGSVIVLIVDDILSPSTKDCIIRLRNVAGETDPQKAKEGTIRHIFGSKLPANAIHVSDSEESFEREFKVLFPGKEGASIKLLILDQKI